MKINYKNILCIILILAVIIILSPKSQAAGLVIAFSQSTANVGDTVTVTVTGQGISGRADLTVSGNATLSENSVFVDNGSASVNLTINGEGSIRVTATAVDMADSATAATYTGATGGTITVTSASSGGSSTGSTSDNTSAGEDNYTAPQESNNANLSNLGIRPNDFTGFRPSTTAYDVTVPEDVESIEVYATAQDSKATISGTGSKTLEFGENTLNVVVTAEDGTTKTYTINVTREGQKNGEDETEENTAVKNGLSNITIGELKLNPSFSTDVYEYTVDYIGEDTSLDIQTVTTDSAYTVEILGNEELKEGENIVTILVTDSEGNNVATYQLTVNKSLVDEEALAREEQQRQKEEQTRMFIIAGAIIALILIIVIVIIVKRRRDRAYAEEFSGVPFAGMNDEDDYYDNYSSNNQFDDYDYDDNETTDIQDNIPQLENDEEENTPIEEEEKKQMTFDDNKEQEEKERAKRDFLNGYNTDNNEDYDYEEDKPKRGRKKGKRFK